MYEVKSVHRLNSSTNKQSGVDVILGGVVGLIKKSILKGIGGKMKTLYTSSTIEINPCLHQMSGNIKMKNSIWVNMSVSCCNPYNMYRLHIMYINMFKSVKYKNKKNFA